MSKSTEELREQIREIMREWEGMFPFPDPDDAGEEARIAYEVPTKLMALLSLELAKRDGEVDRKAFEAGYSCGYDWVLSYSPQKAWEEYIGDTLNNQTTEEDK